MGKRALICKGDTTTHGGRVLEGSETVKIDDKPVAGVGHKVSCPQCKGVFPILPDLLGRHYAHRIGDIDTAVDGMRTACGAVLIASSQSNTTFEDVGNGNPDDGAAASAVPPLPPSPTLCLECLKAAAESGATTVMRG